MLVAHDLLLLLLDDDSGKLSPTTSLGEVLGGALLVELALSGLVDVADEGEDVKSGRIVVRNGPQPPDPRLSEALDSLREIEGKRPASALRALGQGLPEKLIDDLVAGGILRTEKRKVLGVFPSTRHPTEAPEYENALRERLTSVLEGRDGPDARTGPLIALLSAAGKLSVITVEDKRQARAIAKKVGEGDWASDAVRQAVQATNAATAAVIASTAATTAATTGN